jgi:hypothetical protein
MVDIMATVHVAHPYFVHIQHARCEDTNCFHAAHVPLKINSPLLDQWAGNGPDFCAKIVQNYCPTANAVPK